MPASLLPELDVPARASQLLDSDVWWMEAAAGWSQGDIYGGPDVGIGWKVLSRHEQTEAHSLRLPQKPM